MTFVPAGSPRLCPLSSGCRGGLLAAVAPSLAERGLGGSRASVACGVGSEHRPGGCGASSLRGVWGLPGPGMEPVSPALAGGFFTTEPLGRP